MQNGRIVASATSLPRGRRPMTSMTEPTADADVGPASASGEALQTVAAALGHNHIAAIVVDTGEEARDRVLELVPEGSEVHWAKSKTLEDLGLTDIFLDTARFDPVRPKYMVLDRRTQNREI